MLGPSTAAQIATVEVRAEEHLSVGDKGQPRIDSKRRILYIQTRSKFTKPEQNTNQQRSHIQNKEKPNLRARGIHHRSNMSGKLVVPAISLKGEHMSDLTGDIG